MSEIRIHISDNRFRMKVANPIDRAMLLRIKAREDGWVFSPIDFVDLGSRDAVDKALSRMAAGGTIRRVARGLYDVPGQHPIVGVTVPRGGPDCQGVGRQGRDSVAADRSVCGKPARVVGPGAGKGRFSDGRSEQTGSDRQTGHCAQANLSPEHGDSRED